tara:strand:- start:302 stop:691 length:390 start_codon:yes stop_codon:yes gene_type:complete
MRAKDAVKGDILQGVDNIYLRDIELGRGMRSQLAGFEPNPPKRALVAHRWMAWFSEGGYKPGGDDVIVYLGHRWIYRRSGEKRSRKIIREVLFRGRPCWVDPQAWRFLERVDSRDEENLQPEQECTTAT